MMFREIVEAMKRGHTTPASIAREIGVDPEMVRDAILIMVREGIIIEEGEGCEKSEKCFLCPLAGSCKEITMKSFRLKRGD